MLHGSGSPKRTILYSPMKEIAMLDLGPLRKSVREELTKLSTVRSIDEIALYVDWLSHCYSISNQGKSCDKSGKRRFTGNKADLKKSGCPC